MSPHSKWRRGCARLICVMALIMACPYPVPAAQAQQSSSEQKAPSAKQPRAEAHTTKVQSVHAEDVQIIWAKLCGKMPDAKVAGERNACATRFEMFDKKGRMILEGALVTTEGEQKDEVFAVTIPQGPKGIALSPGASLRIDTGESASLRYRFCFTGGCVAEVAAPKAFVEKLKTSRSFAIHLSDAAGTHLVMPNVPLKDFARIYEGPAADPKAYAEVRRKLVEEYRKASAEEAATSSVSTDGKAPPKKK